MGILNVQGIDVTMGGHDILHDVTLEVAEHAVVSVIGSNGVGKTTLMRAISGIYRCAAGTITFRGTPIANLHSHRIVRLGLAQAPEGRMIFSNMTDVKTLCSVQEGYRPENSPISSLTSSRCSRFSPNVCARRRVR